MIGHGKQSFSGLLFPKVITNQFHQTKGQKKRNYEISNPLLQPKREKEAVHFKLL